MSHVFISYVRENEAAAERVAKALRESGIDVWIDRDSIVPGDRWKQEIRKAIQNGACFVACFSKEYSARSKTYMNEELTVAIEELRQRPTDRGWFIPIKLSTCEIPDRDIGAGASLLDIQWLDLSINWDFGVKKLIKVVHRESQSTPTTPKQPRSKVSKPPTKPDRSKVSKPPPKPDRSKISKPPPKPTRSRVSKRSGKATLELVRVSSPGVWGLQMFPLPWFHESLDDEPVQVFVDDVLVAAIRARQSKNVAVSVGTHRIRAETGAAMVSGHPRAGGYETVNFTISSNIITKHLAANEICRVVITYKQTRFDRGGKILLEENRTAS